MDEKKKGNTLLEDRPANKNSQTDPAPIVSEMAMRAAQQKAAKDIKTVISKINASIKLTNLSEEIMREVQQSIKRRARSAKSPDDLRRITESAIHGAQSYLIREAKKEQDEEKKQRAYENAKQEQAEEAEAITQTPAPEQGTITIPAPQEPPVLEEDAQKDAHRETVAQAVSSTQKEATTEDVSEATLIHAQRAYIEASRQERSARLAAEEVKPKNISTLELERFEKMTKRRHMQAQERIKQQLAENKISQKEATERLEHLTRKGGKSEIYFAGLKLQQAAAARQESLAQKADPQGYAAAVKKREELRQIRETAHREAVKRKTEARNRLDTARKNATTRSTISQKAQGGNDSQSRRPDTRKGGIPNRLPQRQSSPTKPRAPILPPMYHNPNIIPTEETVTTNVYDAAREQTITTTTTDTYGHELQVENEKEITTTGPMGGVVGGGGSNGSGWEGGTTDAPHTQGDDDSDGSGRGRQSRKGKNNKKTPTPASDAKRGLKMLLRATPHGRGALIAKNLATGNVEGAIKEGKSAVIYILIAILVLLFFVGVVFLSLISSSTMQNNTTTPVPLKLDKTGPATGGIGQELAYSLTATYPGNAQELIITDPLPPDTEYVSSTPAGVFDAAARTVTWTATQLSIPLTNPITMQVSLVLRTTKDNTNIVNKATATITGGTTGGTTSPGTFIGANPNDCGKYNFSKWPEKNPLLNYGDPDCTYSKELLAEYIVAKDPTHKHEWYDVIVKRETGGTYSPNAYAPGTGIQLTLDAAGAWGLYQMGSSTPPGLPPSPCKRGDPPCGKNGQNDRGDVNWKLQTDNAINYNNNLIKNNCDWWYWRSARAGEIVGAKRC